MSTTVDMSVYAEDFVQVLCELFLSSSVSQVEGAEAEAIDVAKSIIAVFRSDGGEVKGVCTCDLAFGVYSSCSLVMIPASVAQDEVTSGLFSKNSHENYGEIVNVLGVVFNRHADEHLVLAETLSPGEKMADDVLQAMKSFEAYGMQLQVDGYGVGNMYVQIVA